MVTKEFQLLQTTNLFLVDHTLLDLPLCNPDKRFQEFAGNRHGTPSIVAQKIQTGLKNVISKISERYKNPTLATIALVIGISMAIYFMFSIIEEDNIPVNLKKIFILDETDK